jgi:hypothetical protein
MSLIDEVIAFSREYINSPAARTPQRKKQIREALRAISGQNISISCATCYIEALFKIIKYTNMAFSQYELRRGYVALLAKPLNGVKAFTNKQITDELAQEFLRQHPERVVYFTKMPRPATPGVPAGINIIEPAKVIKLEKPAAAEVEILPPAEPAVKPKSAVKPRSRKPAKTTT